MKKLAAVVLALLLLSGCRVLQPDIPRPPDAVAVTPMVQRLGTDCRAFVRGDSKDWDGAVMRWACEKTQPGLPAGQGIPEIDLAKFTETGKTSQGYRYWRYQGEVYMATNTVSRWNDEIIVVDLPAGAAGNKERLAIAFFGEATKVPWLDDWVQHLTLNP